MNICLSLSLSPSMSMYVYKCLIHLYVTLLWVCVRMLTSIFESLEANWLRSRLTGFNLTEKKSPKAHGGLHAF